MGKSRQAEHRAFIDWLAAQAAGCQADAVLVAGDVFDTSAPPSHARELYHRAVLALREAGSELVVLGGNHDSVAVLGESRALLAQLGTRVVPCAADHLEEQVLVLRKRTGGPGAVLCAVPYLRARELLLSLPGESAQDKRQALQQAIRAHYHALFGLARERSESLGGLPIVATGHLATVGASGGEAVREIYVGTLEAFPTDAFPPADYIALGHIHQPMKVGGQEHIRYCGSPIALGFDEAGQRKGGAAGRFRPGGPAGGHRAAGAVLPAHGVPAGDPAGAGHGAGAGRRGGHGRDARLARRGGGRGRLPRQPAGAYRRDGRRPARGSAARAPGTGGRGPGTGSGGPRNPR